MELAIVELVMGLFELIDGDNRRLWQVCHHIKRGFIICFTLGKVRPKYIDYYNGVV